MIYSLIISATLSTCLLASFPVQNKFADKPESLVLTAVELDGLTKVRQTLQLANAKQVEAETLLLETDSEDADAIYTAALKWKRTVKMQRKKVQELYQSWLLESRKIHKCNDCVLSQDEKSLEHPMTKEKN